MSIFLTLLGVLWLAFAVISFGDWASVIPANIMQQIYKQNALLLFVLEVSFAVVFFAAASIVGRLGKPIVERAAPERESSP